MERKRSEGSVPFLEDVVSDSSNADIKKPFNWDDGSERLRSDLLSSRRHGKVPLAGFLADQLLDMRLSFVGVGERFSYLLSGCTDATEADDNIAPVISDLPEFGT